MSERLPLPIDVLRGQRPSSPEVDPQTHAAVHRLLDLADRGDYLVAAEQAAELLRGPVHDVRLVVVYLMGSFVERGATSLPEILSRVDALARAERSAHAGAARRVEQATEWLLRAIADRLAFHTNRRDEVWRDWLATVTPDHIDAIVDTCDRIPSESAGGTALLAKIKRWARERLGPAAARTQKPEPSSPVPAVDEPGGGLEPRWDEADAQEADEPEPDEPDEAYDEYDESDELDEDFDESESQSPFGFDVAFGSRSPSREWLTHGAPSPAASDLDSPALEQLRRKIQGFETLLARGDFDKAALVARDIQLAIEQFDPLVYLPRLFARYLKLLSQSLADIERHWSAEDSTARRVLAQLYRVDLEGFIDD